MVVSLPALEYHFQLEQGGSLDALFGEEEGLHVLQGNTQLGVGAWAELAVKHKCKGSPQTSCLLYHTE